MVLLRWAGPTRLFSLYFLFFYVGDAIFLFSLVTRGRFPSCRYGSRVGGREGRGASVGGVDPQIFLIRNMIY
jgi:hypothetical protein